MPGHRAGRDVTRPAQLGPLDKFELERHVDRAFDGRAADLAVALCRMGIADREDRAIDLDRQIQLRAFGNVADVHIAAHIARRDDAVQARLRGGDPNRSAHGLERHAPAGAVHDRCLKAGVVVPVVQVRVGELVGEQAEAGDVAGPAPARGAKGQYRDLERIARLRAIDVDRPGDRIDAPEIEFCEVAGGGVFGELPGGCVQRFELDALARRDLQLGRKRVIPAVVDMFAVDRVLVMVFAHGLSYTATVNAPSITRLVPEMRLATGLEINTTPLATSAGVPNLPVGLTLSVELYRSGMFFSMFCQMPPSK